MSRKCKTYIGTSGWSYGDWADDVFYPYDLPEKNWLEFYSEHFPTVELNTSFYHLPAAKTFINWRQRTPPNFLFSVKISRYLTHIKKLSEPKEPWQRFIKNARELREKLGPILVQLPPNFKVNQDKLNNLLKIIPEKYKIALEVRDDSWFNKDIYQTLKRFNVALVNADSQEWPTPDVTTADFIYVRMHGPVGLYDSKYSTAQLKKLAEKIKSWKKEKQEIYVYFNNDTKGYAVENAKKLRQLVFK